ncbi:VOC family protein [Niallia oryzisoli]|uniref:VOC family protein n=1 Tax=Niallia oryzisoli TaxID=1737571 RepID=A0ABZ2CH11_9BACI
MIDIVGQIMLYVDNQEESLKFWTEKAGFTLISEEEGGPMKWYVVAPSKDAQTSIVLHNKELVAKMSPGVNLETPSLMFFTKDIERLYQDFKAKQITVGDMVEMPGGRVFNFADHEENYFAVMEKN